MCESLIDYKKLAFDNYNISARIIGEDVNICFVEFMNGDCTEFMNGDLAKFQNQ